MNLETRYCALCGDDAPKEVRFAPNFSEADLNDAIFSARRMPDRRHFRLVECRDCGMVYSDPACPPAELSRLYADGKVNYGSQEEQIFESYRPVLDRALTLTKQRNVFLEIGGGRGFMLKYGADKGFREQIEIEPSEDAAKKFERSTAESRFIHGMFTPGLLPKWSVSLACFFQILDHVPDPSGFLSEVFEVLEPGGAVVCVTHNTLAVSARLLGEKSPIYDIEHTYLFNPHNLSSLFEKKGFEAVTAFPVSNKYSIRYWFHLAPLPPKAKRGLSPLLEKTRIADLRLPLYAGNFGVVARKPR